MIDIILKVIIIILVHYLFYRYYKKYKFNLDMTYVKSEIDNLEYKVRNLNDKTIAANTLSIIKNNLVRLVNYLSMCVV